MPHVAAVAQFFLPFPARLRSHAFGVQLGGLERRLYGPSFPRHGKRTTFCTFARAADRTRM